MLKKPTNPNSSILLESSLQGFFFDRLCEMNEQSTNPLPKEALYYSSLVMDRLGESENYFAVEDGKVRDKILGTKLLETNQMDKQNKKRTLQDIGDTALILCGYFSDSLNKKIVDPSYYQILGISAYNRLDSLIPEVYEIPEFFHKIAQWFHHLTMLISLVANDFVKQPEPVSIVISDLKKIRA